MPRIVFLTGASGGIGQAVANRLSSGGLIVIGFDLHPPGAASNLSAFTTVDVSDADALTGAVRCSSRSVGALPPTWSRLPVSLLPDISRRSLPRT